MKSCPVEEAKHIITVISEKEGCVLEIMGKGCKYRPSSTGREERELRLEYAYGRITQDEYAKRFADLLKAGKIVRSGRVIQ